MRMKFFDVLCLSLIKCGHTGRTGWGPVKEPLRRLFGDELIDETSEIWGTDEEGELRGVYRPTGHPGVRPYHKHPSMNMLTVLVALVCSRRFRHMPCLFQTAGKHEFTKHHLPLSSLYGVHRRFRSKQSN